MADPDEMSAVLALGILAGMLALVQFWGSAHRSVLGDVGYPIWGEKAQSWLFLTTLGAFSFYLFLMILGVGLDNLGVLPTISNDVISFARWEFLFSWLVTLAFVSLVVIRLLAGTWRWRRCKVRWEEWRQKGRPPIGNSDK